jgi:hypothetical protein
MLLKSVTLKSVNIYENHMASITQKRKEFIKGRRFNPGENRKLKFDIRRAIKRMCLDLKFTFDNNPELFSLGETDFVRHVIDVSDIEKVTKNTIKVLENDIDNLEKYNESKQKIIDIFIKYRNLPEFKKLLKEIKKRNKLLYYSLTNYFSKKNIESIKSEKNLDKMYEKILLKNNRNL